MSFDLFSSSFHVIIVFSSSWYRMIFLSLHGGLMFPCRASDVVIVLRLSSRGLLLASVNAYHASDVVIVSSLVVSWPASCIG